MNAARLSPIGALLGALLAVLCTQAAAPAGAQTPDPNRSVEEGWAEVQPPPLPEIRGAKLDPAKTVLLVMDFNRITCAANSRPRCAAALPRIASLLAAARANHVLVVHTLSGTTTGMDIPDLLAPLPDERIIPPRTDKPFGRMDKFFDSDLESSLRARGIDTVLAVGTSANGAVLYTASGAAARGFAVVIPIDGMPADTAYQEQFTAYQLLTAPVIRGHVSLTRSNAVSFAGGAR